MLEWQSLKFEQGYPENAGLALSELNIDMQKESMGRVEYSWLNISIIAIAIGCLLMFYFRLKKRVPIQSVSLDRRPYKNEMALNLHLARQYVELEDIEHALPLLKRVCLEGNALEREEANGLIKCV